MAAAKTRPGAEYTDLQRVIVYKLTRARSGQLGPAVLLKQVTRHMLKAGKVTTQQDAERAMFKLISEGRTEWTKEGPIRLIGTEHILEQYISR